MSYLIECCQCGKRENKSPLYCDKCGCSIDYLIIDGFYYTPEELDENNIYLMEE